MPRIVTWYGRRSAWFRRLVLFLFSVTILGLVLWFTPTPYYITAPGAAVDTSRLVRVAGAEVRRDRLYMLIVTTRPANLLLYLYHLADSRSYLESREEFLDGLPDYEEYVESTRRMMTDSQNTAKAVAEQLLGYGRGATPIGVQITAITTYSQVRGILALDDVIVAMDGKPVRKQADLREILAAKTPGAVVAVRVRRGGRELDLHVRTVEHPDPEYKGRALLGVQIEDSLIYDVPIPVEIKPGAITGPSAGLMFTLQIIDQLSPEPLAGDLLVAGTGTVEWDGRVGAIGGVKQKVYTAEAAGAQVIFVPVDNYPDASEAATRIQVVPVETVQDALDWLRANAKTGRA